MPSTRAGVPNFHVRALSQVVGHTWKTCCMVVGFAPWSWPKGSMSAAVTRQKSPVISGSNRLGSTARRLKLWQSIPALSISCPAAPPAPPGIFHCACGGGDAPGRTLLAPAAGQERSTRSARPHPWSSAAKLHPIDNRTTSCCYVILIFLLVASFAKRSQNIQVLQWPP